MMIIFIIRFLVSQIFNFPEIKKCEFPGCWREGDQSVKTRGYTVSPWAYVCGDHEELIRKLKEVFFQ